MSWLFLSAGDRSMPLLYAGAAICALAGYAATAISVATLVTLGRSRVLIDGERGVLAVRWCVMERWLVPWVVRRREFPMADVLRITFGPVYGRGGSGEVLIVETRLGRLNLWGPFGGSLQAFAETLSAVAGRPLTPTSPAVPMGLFVWVLAGSILVVAILVAALIFYF